MATLLPVFKNARAVRHSTARQWGGFWLVEVAECPELLRHGCSGPC